MAIPLVEAASLFLMFVIWICPCPHSFFFFLHLPKLQSWPRQWHPTPVLWPRKSHRRRSLVGCSPWGREESDMTERLHFDFSLSCTGEGNGDPLQRFCLENPRDGGACWAAVYGVAQSWTRLKRLSSSSSSIQHKKEWNTDTCHNMGEPWKHAKWKKPVTKKHVYCSVYTKCPEKANLWRQSRLVVARV